MIKLPLFYKYAGESFELENAWVMVFVEALENFCELENREFSQEELRSKAIRLSNAYYDLMIEILSSDDDESNYTSAKYKKLEYVLCSLLEAEDRAKAKEIASDLLGLFDDFIEGHYGDPFFMKHLKIYADSDILKCPPVKMYIERLYKRWL